MPSPSDSLKSRVHSLFDSLLVRVLGQAVAEVVLSSYFPYRYSASGNLVLKPQLIKLDVPNFSQTSAAGDSLCRRRVRVSDNRVLNPHVLEHPADPHGIARSLHHAVVLCLSR